MRKIVIGIVGIAAGIAMLGACSQQPTYQPDYTDVSSVNQQQYSAPRDSHNDALVAGAIAGAAGYALGKSSGRKEAYKRDYQRPYRYNSYRPKRTYESRSSWSRGRSSYTGGSRFSSRRRK